MSSKLCSKEAELEFKARTDCESHTPPFPRRSLRIKAQPPTFTAPPQTPWVSCWRSQNIPVREERECSAVASYKERALHSRPNPPRHHTLGASQRLSVRCAPTHHPKAQVQAPITGCPGTPAWPHIPLTWSSKAAAGLLSSGQHGPFWGSEADVGPRMTL